MIIPKDIEKITIDDLIMLQTDLVEYLNDTEVPGRSANLLTAQTVLGGLYVIRTKINRTEQR